VHYLLAIIIPAFLILVFDPFAVAQSTGLLQRNIPIKNNIVTFPNDKGEVIFNHSIHSKKFEEKDCILCHRANQPISSKVLARFDNPRIAHYFCKGCHREMGCGPIECHECHNYKKQK